MSREKAAPPRTIRSDKKGTVKLLQWESGGRTIVVLRPPPKDDPEGDWTEEKLNYKFTDQAEAIIEVLQRDLDGEDGDEHQYKSEAKKSYRSDDRPAPRRDERREPAREERVSKYRRS